MGEHLEKLAGVVYPILFVVALAFIFVGIRLVYLGTAERLTFELFDMLIPSGIVGKTSIAIGAAGLMVLVWAVLRSVKDMFSLRPWRNDR